MNLTNVIVTAYCACRICCGPNADGVTAAGTKPKQGRTVAAPRSISFGTRVRIEGFNTTFIVEDRTARRFDGRWDIFFAKHKDALKFGKQRLTITTLWTGQP